MACFYKSHIWSAVNTSSSFVGFSGATICWVTSSLCENHIQYHPWRNNSPPDVLLLEDIINLRELFYDNSVIHSLCCAQFTPTCHIYFCLVGSPACLRAVGSLCSVLCMCGFRESHQRCISVFKLREKKGGEWEKNPAATCPVQLYPRCMHWLYVLVQFYCGITVQQHASRMWDWKEALWLWRTHMDVFPWVLQY